MKLSFPFFLLVLITMLMGSNESRAQDGVCFVNSDDPEARAELYERMNDIFCEEIVVSGDSPFLLIGADPLSNCAFPSWNRSVVIRPGEADGRIRFQPEDHLHSDLCFADIVSEGHITIVGGEFSNFGNQTGSGGAFNVTGNGSLTSVASIYETNFAALNGAAISISGDGEIVIIDNQFRENIAGERGGAIFVSGPVAGSVQNSIFTGNLANIHGSDIFNVGPLNPDDPFLFSGSVFSADPDSISELDSISRVFFDSVAARGSHNTFMPGDQEDAVYADDSKVDFHDLVIFAPPDLQQKKSTHEMGIQSACNETGAGTIESLGFNVVSDDSCSFDQPSDLTSTDPLLEPNENGIPIPQAGSPVIDIGPDMAVVLGDDTLASLPCGHADVLGLGRPQDANGDGVFECDSGAVEVSGAGAVVPGHSGAFFNSERDGEGTYVEILSDTLALVYTFSYRPDGSGPAWFLGVGLINGNSIVIPDLIRPIGATFGDAFDAADVVFTQSGAMSMVFPDCSAEDTPGNTAYTGDRAQGYEGLITRAQRLAHITGCGTETPSPNVGLSGSYFDPARNGEGIIVQWLTSGEVLVVFFTFDLSGEQMWLIGIGTPNGKTVTMDALYAASFTSWGRPYDPDEVSIETWGDFTLTWGEACNAVDFEYTSTVEGYGSAEHNYTSLSKLAGTSCP